VVIVDYDMGNTDSIFKAVELCGGKPTISRNKYDFENSSHIILPGVGSFSAAMENIQKYGIDLILKEEVIEQNKFLLGICLGMQIMATFGHEGGTTKGLNLIEGEVKILQPIDSSSRIPHIGWNEVIFKKNHPLFNEIKPATDFYFVHSYHFICKNENDSLAFTPYCGGFTSVTNKDNVYGVQFHPEKSQKYGLKLIKNFLNL